MPGWVPPDVPGRPWVVAGGQMLAHAPKQVDRFGGAAADRCRVGPLSSTTPRPGFGAAAEVAGGGPGPGGFAANGQRAASGPAAATADHPRGDGAVRGRDRSGATFLDLLAGG